MRRLVGLVTAACAALLLVAPASAQTVVSEPPGLPTTTIPAPAVETRVVIELVLDLSNGLFSGIIEVCGYAPGGSVSYDWQGTGVGGGTADARGCVQIPIVIKLLTITGTAAGVPLPMALISSVDGKPVDVAAVRQFAAARQLAAARSCTLEVTVNGRQFNTVNGDHVLTTVGPMSNGALRTVRNIVRIGCGDGTAEASGGTTGGVVTPTPVSQPGEGAFAFTGTNVVRYVLFAAALLAGGVAMRRFGRRRGAAASS